MDGLASLLLPQTVPLAAGIVAAPATSVGGETPTGFAALLAQAGAMQRGAAPDVPTAAVATTAAATPSVPDALAMPEALGPTIGATPPGPTTPAARQPPQRPAVAQAPTPELLPTPPGPPAVEASPAAPLPGEPSAEVAGEAPEASPSMPDAPPPQPIPEPTAQNTLAAVPAPPPPDTPLPTTAPPVVASPLSSAPAPAKASATATAPVERPSRKALEPAATGSVQIETSVVLARDPRLATSRPAAPDSQRGRPTVQTVPAPSSVPTTRPSVAAIPATEPEPTPAPLDTAAPQVVRPVASTIAGVGKPAIEATPHAPPTIRPATEEAPGQDVLVTPAAGTAMPPTPHTVEAAAPVAPAPPAASPARQIAPVLVAVAIAGGTARLSVTLEPAELGRVEISVERKGEATDIRVVAERPETLALMQRDQRELDRTLAQAGIGSEGRSLSFSLSDGGSFASGRDAEGRGQPGRGHAPEVPTNAAPAEVASPRRLLSLIDLAV